MWCIIRRMDDGNYDIIPNDWIVNERKCLYPNCGLAGTKKMAKQCEHPHQDWEHVEMTIEKRNIDDYERGMKDVIRMSQGKRTLTSSEGEEVGRGKRKKVKKNFFGRLNDGDSSDSSMGLNGIENLNEICENTEPQATPSFPNLITYPTTSTNNSDIGERGSNKKYGKKRNMLEDNNQMCKIQRGKHFCCFQENSKNPPDLTTIGHALCHISRSLSSLHNNIGYLKERLDEIENKGSLNTNCVVTNEDHKVHLLDSLDCFPLRSMKQLLEMETKLKDDAEFFGNLVKAFSSISEKNSLSRTVTSVLKNMMTLEVGAKFTFKGIHRKDHKEEKKAFKDLKLARVLFDATAMAWKGEECDFNKIGNIAATWLAQTTAKLEKSKKIPSLEINENDVE